MESNHTADSCAKYLGKLYILPHTYRASFTTRFFLAPLASISFVVVMAWIVLPEWVLQQQHPNPHENWKMTFVILFGITIYFCFFTLSFMWRKTVITRHSIDITLSLSKKSIPSKNIVGYALDSVRQSKGPDGWRLSIVHNEPGRPQAKTRLTFNPEDLNEPRLQGLFMSMSNYGDVSLSEWLDEISGNKYPILEKVVLVGLVLLTSFLLLHGLPAILHALEQLG